ncbi:HAD family hydrolase [Bacillus sp. USDA818B3_A]|uniref:HAD family hydrolase n=1 Tax=Bacillus sp. USDA818B3_A TaxID=2698834 RepID=UPI0013695A5E|nr:HAD family hydrolase [Bacillus sp. USDA818B3_A]
MKKIIFLDIDGTLMNDNGVIPESAALAVRKARENGHLVFICTGRSRNIIFPEIIEVGFDGIIGAAGGYIEIGDNILFHEKIKKENVQHLVEFFDTHEIDFFLESNEGTFSSKNAKKRMLSDIERYLLDKPDFKEEIEKGFMPFYEMLIEGEELIRENVNKIVFFGSDSLPFERIAQEFESIFTIIPNTVSAFKKDGGELSILGINKSTAIMKVIEHFNIRKEHTFAYGDSLNDLEMLEYVQYGIAMGNAHEAVKKVADDVTESHDQNGIYNSFKKYGLI